MRTITTLLLVLLLSPGPVPATIIKVLDISAGSSDTFSVTSPSSGCTGSATCDTTGSTLLIVGLANVQTFVTTLSDSRSNSWNALTSHASTVAGNCQFTIFYAKVTIPATQVGPNHTFTFTNGTANFPSISVSAWSGVDTVSPFDQQNGNGNSGAGATLPTGNITPTLPNELWVSGTCASSTMTPLIGTLINTAVYGPGLHFGAATSFLVQTTATTVQETWSFSPNSLAGDGIASFKVSTASGEAKHKVLSAGRLK